MIEEVFGEMSSCDLNNVNDSLEYNHEQKGICLIKSEYIIKDRIRPSNDNNIEIQETEETKKTNESNEPATKKFKFSKKEKYRGQNKARPPPFKALRQLNLCPSVADQIETEPTKNCQNPNCTFLHDKLEYMKLKPEDIGTDCYVFNLTGRCPWGTACRVGSKHITKDGFNIIDEEKLKKIDNKNIYSQNNLSKDLQYKLRKRMYNFSNAEKIVKHNKLIQKKLQSTSNKYVTSLEEELKNSTSDQITENNDESHSQKAEINLFHEKKKIGPNCDYDIIKEREEEKRKIDWNDKILLSPLTTVGNLPFRRICKEYGADITCGEMTLAPKILKGAYEEWALVKRHECEDLFGVQLCGNNPEVLTRCTQLLNEEIDIDFIDLNLGCPIDLVYRQGGGSGMLNRLNVLETVVKSISQVSSLPITIKTRTGVYMNKSIAHTLMPKFRDWGASMITVHGRSREQRYTKLANWEYIEQCAQAAKPIPVYGNGDIMSYYDYQRVKENYPTVKGITIGRGALIKPWIFKEIKEQRLIDVSSRERFDILKKFVKYGLQHWGSDTRGVETTRRFMLEWLSFLYRYVPVEILANPPQKINERPPYYRGRDEMETLMSSSDCSDWTKISEMLLGKVPEGFHFIPKHKANSWK